MAEKESKFKDNVPGAWYIDDQCIDCDVCREIAPDIFGHNEKDGHSYVKKQPENDMELAKCQEAMEECPVEAIGNDGD
jgi:ferredoxin